MNIGKLLWVHLGFNGWGTFIIGYQFGRIYNGDWVVLISLGLLTLELGPPLEDD